MATGTGEEALRQLAARGRRHVVRAVAHAGAGHIGGPFSAMDILVALYFRVLRVDPARPELRERDRFVLSKGHSAMGLYAVLAMRGFFPESWLPTFDSLGSPLQGHPDMLRCPGVEMSTGSLGQGISAGLGMALGAERLGLPGTRVFVLLGDGECQEGQVWECAHTAARLGARRLCAIVDWNGLPQYGWPGEAPMALRREDLAGRFAAFGWEVAEVDGHDPEALSVALAAAPGAAPRVLIARTQKGRGVSFMQDQAAWHARVPTAEELAAAEAELQAAGADGAAALAAIRACLPGGAVR